MGLLFSRWMSRQRLWTLGVALLVGLGGVLYGYDIGVISGALLFINKSIPMTSTQTGIIVGAVLWGGLLGTLAAGPLADRYGRRPAIALSCVVFLLGIGFILLAHSFMTLLFARLFLGIAVGIVAVAVPLYVTELVPARDRGKYVTFFQLFLTAGILSAYLVDFLFASSGNWRAMFGVVAVPAIILLIGVLRLPESPRWLVGKNRIVEAQKVLARTRNKADVMCAVIAIKSSLEEVKSGWGALFSSKVFLPLLIAVSVAILNQLTGINVFLQYAPTLLKQSGFGSNEVDILGSVGIGCANFLCTLLALLFIDRIGRKPLLIIGTFGIIVAELFMGTVSRMALSAHMSGSLMLVGLIMFIVFYAIGPGVVVWLTISELFPTPARSKGIAICLFFNSLAGSTLATIFLDLQHVLGMAGTYWLCAFFTFIYFLVACFFLPETRSQTLEDIQKYFRNKRAQSYIVDNDMDVRT